MKCRKIILLAAMLCGVGAVAGEVAEYSATVIGTGASGDFAPYMIGSWNHGKTVMNGAALLDAEMHKDLDLSKRLSWAAGAEFLTGYSASADYQRFTILNNWVEHSESPAKIWLQQLYASVKWRGVFVTAGMKERGSCLVDNDLSSGDLVHSNNARPVPQVRAGFVDYQDIPFTQRWVQIEGTIAYGKTADSDYQRDRYNYYNGHISTGTLYTHKRISFRTNPDKRLSVSASMQAAGFYGGTTRWYSRAQAGKVVDNPGGVEAAWKMFFPKRGNGDGYMEGSQLGSYDFKARYRLNGSHEVALYFQWLWEDGSSLGRRNKTDGLWGIEYHRTDGAHTLLKGIVAEIIDFRDQSGPLHWAPGDNAGTTMTGEATGGDDYYNNTSFNAYTNYGMSLGSPFVLAPVYNTDGFLQYKYTRSSGMHIAANGYVSNSVMWRAAVSYAKAWGNGRHPQNTARENTSMMVEATWDAARLLPGLSMKGMLAFDAGKLRGDNVGALFSITYKGNFSLCR
jgi:hypothetical protein